MENHSINSRNYAIAYLETLEEVHRTLVLKKMIKKSKRFEKLEKLRIFLNIDDIEILQNIPLRLEAMQ